MHNPDLFEWLMTYEPKRYRRDKPAPKPNSKPRHRRPWQRYIRAHNVYKYA